MPAAKKPRLARNIRFEPRAAYCDNFPAQHPAGVSVFFAGNDRGLRGPVGKRLHALGSGGNIVFLDGGPREYVNRPYLLVAGVDDGLMVTYIDRWNGVSEVEMVRVCNAYRRRIVGGHGEVRWAKVKTT